MKRRVEFKKKTSNKRDLLYEIEVYKKDPRIYLKDIEFILPNKKIELEFSKLYLIEDSNLNLDDLYRASEQLFYDPIAEKYKIKIIKNRWKIGHSKINKNSKKWSVKVYYKPEVTDPATEYIIKALKDIKLKVSNVRTGKKYILKSNTVLKYDEVYLIARRLLANLNIENVLLKPI